MGCMCSIGKNQDAFASGETTEKDILEHQLAFFGQQFHEVIEQYDEDASGDLSIDEIGNFLDQQLNLNISQLELERKFQEFDRSQDAKLDKQEFICFLLTLYNRNEITGIFKQYQTNLDINASTMRRFLQFEQGEQVTENQAQKIIATLNMASGRGAAGRKALTMGFHELQMYLFGNANWVLDPDHLEVCEDMTRPLTDYFIATSHNTYLTGHQLYGSSSVDMYMHALLRGCRCVELDCWDGPKDSETGVPVPIIYRGHSLASQVSFRETIECIRKYAFPSSGKGGISPYPVILSLEMHCSKSYQEQIAAILVEVLGDVLPSHAPDPNQPLPSPEALREKVLIKSKSNTTLTTEADADAAEANQDIAEALAQQREEAQGKLEAQLKEWDKKKSEDPTGGSFFGTSYSPEKEILAHVEPDERPVEAIDTADLEVHPALAKLIYLKVEPGATPSKHLEQQDRNSTYGSRSSMYTFVEGKVEAISQTAQAAEMVSLTKHKLTRVYPAGIRTDSTNFSPMIAWGLGCQMATLNYQTMSSPMAMNDALFSRNGRSGYVTKPSFMQDRNSEVPREYHPQTYTPHNYALVVRVISGCKLPKENGDKCGEVIDPSVMLELHCSTGSVQNKNTQPIRKNGYNPIWDELFEFKIKNLDFSLLTFTVYDIDFLRPDYIAHSGVFVKNIREGYRFVPLMNAQGDYIPEAGLLCHFHLQQSIGH